MSADSPSGNASRDEQVMASGGALAGLAALLSASCCILPLVLANLGVGSALAANLSELTPYRPWLIGLTVAIVGVGLALTFRRGRRPTRMVAGLFSAAALFAVSAILIPTFESDILTWLNL